jgi:hypothetical protein
VVFLFSLLISFASYLLRDKNLFYCDGVEILPRVSDEETKHERDLEAGKSHGVQTPFSLTTSEVKSNEAKGEKNSKQEEPKIDLVMNIPQKSSLPVRKESWNNDTEHKGTSLFAYHP